MFKKIPILKNFLDNDKYDSFNEMVEGDRFYNSELRNGIEDVYLGPPYKNGLKLRFLKRTVIAHLAFSI